MPKYQPYSRRELSRLRAAWLRRNAPLLAAVTAGLLAVLGIETLVLVHIANPSAFGWWLLGALQVGAVGAFAHLLNTSFLAHEGAAMRHVRGSWGEENTRSELRTAKRKRLIWDWVDSIDLQNGDIDHLVVPRRGGLVVIDSKWRNRIEDTHDMARAARRAQVRAEGVARSLLLPERGTRHRAKANPLSVTPVVVLWGAAQDEVPRGSRIGEIEFIKGRDLMAWLRDRDGAAVTPQAARDLITRIEQFRADAWRASRDGFRR